MRDTKWERMLKLQVVEMLAAFLGAGALVSAATLPMPYEDRLAILCAVGGILGSAFSVLVSTPKSHREALIVFLANSIAAYTWGPWLIQALCDYKGWELTSRNAIGMSATIGATTTTLLKPIVIVMYSKLMTWVAGLSIAVVIARLFGLKFEETEKRYVKDTDDEVIE